MRRKKVASVAVFSCGIFGKLLSLGSLCFLTLKALVFLHHMKEYLARDKTLKQSSGKKMQLSNVSVEISLGCPGHLLI